jgi:hypothetical protein
MKNEAQYKAVDRVAMTFKQMIPYHNHMTIWFEQEKACELRTRGHNAPGDGNELKQRKCRKEKRSEDTSE